jgi:malate dehydrogenase (oxaloacetate-decarboxylating)
MYYKKTKKVSGINRLEDPLLNKNTAFSKEERIKYKLFGLLPPKIETLEEQLVRTKLTFSQKHPELQKHIFLRALQDINEILFYRFLMENIQETMPIIYTPTVGQACQQFSKIYRKPRGLYLSYKEKDQIENILRDIKKKRDIKVIVITDGERILGLGDQGVGGLGIPIGKLSLYTLCGGIHPACTLPIVIDVGTNNPELQQEPTYLGWQHKRLEGKPYFSFLDTCVQSIKKVFPKALLQFEDFAQGNAHALLDIYQDQLCCFNDDIQGTAAVAAATVLSAVFKIKSKLETQKICIFGAGAAGCGIASLLAEILIYQGMSEEDAYQHFYMIDKNGLLHSDMTDLHDFQKPFIQTYDTIKELFPNQKSISLNDVIQKLKPTILVGVSGQKGKFDEASIRAMGTYCKSPIILPLSNPNEKCEAEPHDLLEWTEGRAIIASGSPFPNTRYKGQLYPIAQCNNSYIFPALGLAIIAGKIKRVLPSMFIKSALELARIANEDITPNAPLLPSLENIREVSKKIAKAVIYQAIEDKQSSLKPKENGVNKAIKETFWVPKYN